MSVERYIFIHYPLRYVDILSKKRALGCIGFTWLYATLGTGTFVVVARPGFIRLHTIEVTEASPTFYTYFMVPNFFILSLTILVLNVKIAVTAWKQSKRIQTDAAVQQQNQDMISNQIEITNFKMLVTVVGVSLLLIMASSLIWIQSYIGYRARSVSTG